jgi:hypothetical protein
VDDIEEDLEYDSENFLEIINKGDKLEIVETKNQTKN